MEIDISPTVVQDIILQIQQRNAFTAGFKDVVGDYQSLLRKVRESKVFFLAISRLYLMIYYCCEVCMSPQAIRLLDNALIVHIMVMAYQIRNNQLEKEARELRAENTTLQQAAEQNAHAAVSSEKVRAPF